MRKLVVFGGPPCTGKSTVGRALGYAHVEMDAARAAILPNAAHTREDRAIAYRAVLWTAAQLLRYTDIAICDGGYGRQADRDACVTLARESGSEFYLVEFTAPLDILLRRNRERRAHHPGLDLDDARVTGIVETYPWSGTGLLVDSTRPVADCVSAVREYLHAAGGTA
jgi:predicted kinase